MGPAQESLVETERARRLTVRYGDPEELNGKGGARARASITKLAWNSLWVPNSRENSMHSVRLQRKSSREEAMDAWNFKVIHAPRKMRTQA